MYGQAEEFSKSASLLRIAYEGFAQMPHYYWWTALGPLGCEDDFPGSAIFWVDHSLQEYVWVGLYHMEYCRGGV